jgi:hypothetical protein
MFSQLLIKTDKRGEVGSDTTSALFNLFPRYEPFLSRISPTFLYDDKVEELGLFREVNLVSLTNS